MSNQQIRFDRPFRQSDITTYLICPRMFYYQEILGIPSEYRSGAMIVGSATHAVIEKIHAERMEDEQVIGSALWNAIEAEERAENVPVFWKDGEKENRFTEALKTLTGYVAKPVNREAEILLSEGSFEVSIGRYPFTGTVDQVRWYGDKLILVEFKLSSMRPSEEFLRRSYQLSVYAYALVYGIFRNSKSAKPFSFDRSPDEIWLYHLKDHCVYKRTSGNNKKGTEKGPAVYKTYRTEQDLVYLKEDLARICGSIRRNIFFRNPSLYGSCTGFCHYQAVCLGEMEQPKITRAHIKALNKLEEVHYD